MKRQLSTTIYGLKFAMEKNDFERLKSSSGKKRNDFVANPIVYCDKLGKDAITVMYCKLDRIQGCMILLHVAYNIFLFS